MNPANRVQQRFWECMGESLSAGQKLLDCLRQASAVVEDEAARKAVKAIAADVAAGATLAHAMAKHPTVFPPEIVSAVEGGDRGGVLDWVALQLSRLLADNSDLAFVLAPLQPDVVELVSRLIAQALTDRASDIHIEPLSHGRTQIRMRVDGVLYECASPPEGKGQAVVDYFKIMGAVNVKERRLPQDGVCTYRRDGKTRTMRIATMPTHFGERLVARLYVHEDVGPSLDLAKLGLAEQDLEAVRRLTKLPAGIIIANGPMGSGKTTLLYSMLQEIREPGTSIMTLEDPVEYTFDGISQTHINPAIGLTFARGLRHILRQDPDIIMVGEIRDREVAQICVQCALTGHLLLTTLHANTSLGAVRRLVDIGVEPWLVSSSLAGVVSIRLIRQLCPKCRQPVDPPLHSMSPEARKVLETIPNAQFYRPIGCEACGGGHGYRSRIGIFEVLVMNDALRQRVTDGASQEAIHSAAVEAGMRTFLLDGMEKAARGMTTIEEVLRVLPIQP